MPLASYILATHHRPNLLAASVARILTSDVPAGWDFEVVVAANAEDEAGRMVAEQLGVRVVLALSTFPGGKFTAAYRASKGQLVLVSGDDDLQSPDRLAHAIGLHQHFEVVGSREFRFLELESGRVARWHGPAAKVGACRSFRRSVLDSVGGWRDLPRGIDTDMQCRLEQYNLYPREGQLPLSVGLSTVCLQHGNNIWKDRQFPAAGEVVQRGHFTITGEGHWTDIDDFPDDVYDMIGTLGPAAAKGELHA